MLKPVFSSLQDGARQALDALLPRLCALCDGQVEGEAGLCAGCWGGLHMIAPPCCEGCGLPFAFAAGTGPLRCGACLAEPPRFSAARAALLYNEASRKLILPFKSHDRTDLAPLLARMLRGAGGALLAEAELLVPVPLHFWRQWRRRYNQAALLTRELAKLSGKPVLLDAITRIRATPSQGLAAHSRAQRRANMARAFRVPAQRVAQITGKKILLIDDVLTTGATANACAEALLKAGAAQVSVLALARVAKVAEG